MKPGIVEERDYQINIASVCRERSTLVVLPTGLGKTIIALLVMIERLEEGKILFLAPTRPLVEQHASFLKKALELDEESISLFTGNVAPAKRAALFETSRIVISTPQVIENDLISGRIRLNDVSMIIFDEAHRGVGNYAYVFIAERYRQDRTDQNDQNRSAGKTKVIGKDRAGSRLALGITASPGSSSDKILEVCENLGMEGVEIRSEYDADVYTYVQKVKVMWVEVELPKEVKRIRDLLNELYVEHLKKLQKWGLLHQTTMVSKKLLLDVQKRIQARIFSTNNPPKSLFMAASLQSGAMKLNHGMELAETQGVHALREYFDRLDAEAHSRSGGKAAKLLLADDRVRMAMRLTQKEESEHPKLAKVIEVLNSEFSCNRNSRVIVFTHFRDTSEMVTRELEKIPGIRPVRFVGQASRGEDKGMNQKLQVETIRKFEEGVYNVLVATSVAEEGLDIPSTDLVVFYEPVPSEIRTIQRRGRTGRKHAGKVVILITKGTRDNAYYWASVNKERNMQKELRSLRNALKGNIEVDSSIGRVQSRRKTISDLKKPPIIKQQPTAPLETREPQAGEGFAEEEHRVIKGQTQIFDFKQSIPQDNSREVDTENDTDKQLEPEVRTWNVGNDRILVDTREFNSTVVRELSRNGYIIDSELLPIGDYIISDRVGVERKTAEDFIASLKDGRLFQQLGLMKKAFIRPVVILEGGGLFESGGMNPAAIYGALASIVTDYGIPMIYTSDEKETATMITSISKREYAESRPSAARVDIGAGLLDERQRFIVEGLPNISAVLARRLLDHFGSVRAVLSATEEELTEVRGVGRKIAKEIVRVLDAGYLRKKSDGSEE